MSDLSLSKDFEGSWCEIKTAENALVAVGKLRTVAPKYIIIEDKEKEIPAFEAGVLLKINLFMPQTEPRVCIGNVYTSSKKELSLVNVISLVNQEKRNFVRVDTNIKTKAVFRKNERSLYPNEADVTVLDMSISGMRIKSTEDFVLNSVIAVKLELKAKKDAMIHCEVLRITEKNPGEGIKKYGCRFVYEENDDTDLVTDFLFEKQREFIRTSAFLKKQGGAV